MIIFFHLPYDSLHFPVDSLDKKTLADEYDFSKNHTYLTNITRGSPYQIHQARRLRYSNPSQHRYTGIIL